MILVSVIRIHEDDMRRLQIERLDEVLKLTAEIFPGTVIAELDCDPEDPETEYLVIRVRADLADGRSALQREIQWCGRVAAAAPNGITKLRLVVSPASVSQRSGQGARWRHT